MRVFANSSVFLERKKKKERNSLPRKAEYYSF